MSATLSPAPTFRAPKAAPGEPVFTLYGRDPAMAGCITTWVALREAMINAGVIPNTPEERAQLASALAMAEEVVAWQRRQANASDARQTAYAAARASYREEIFSRAGQPEWVG